MPSERVFWLIENEEDDVPEPFTVTVRPAHAAPTDEHTHIVEVPELTPTTVRDVPMMLSCVTELVPPVSTYGCEPPETVTTALCPTSKESAF